MKLYARFPFNLRGYLAIDCGVPFKVDFVSEAKCQERVFDAAVPKRYTVWEQHTYYSFTRKKNCKFNVINYKISMTKLDLEENIPNWTVTYLKVEHVVLLDKHAA